MTQPSAPQDTRLSSSPVLIYTLTRVYPWDTDLVPSPPGSGPEYKVTTEVLREKLFNVAGTEVTEKFTYVATTSGDMVATLQWRDMLSDKVTLRGRPSMGMNSWMKPAGGGVFQVVSSATFQDAKGRKYRWKKIAVWHQLELHVEDTHTGAIAAFTHGGMDPFTKVYKHGTLALTARAVEIAELCVLSFLFLEKRRRLWQREAEKRGELGRLRAELNMIGFNNVPGSSGVGL